MAVSFFGGANGAGARVWSAGTFVTDQQDKEKLRERIRELESLCTEVLVAGVDIGLPQHLLNQLCAAVGHGEMPHAYHVDLPTTPPRQVDVNQEAASVSIAPPAVEAEAPAPALRGKPMDIPDIPLTNNPMTSAADNSRPKPPQAELKPLTVKKT